MNDKSIWSVIGSVDSIPPEDLERESAVTIARILSFLKERENDVGASIYSLSVEMISVGTGIPESTVYRYMQRLIGNDLIELEIKRVPVLHKIEWKIPQAGSLPTRVFKDIDDSELLPENIDTPFIFIESGETTIKMYRLTGAGKMLLDRYLKNTENTRKKEVNDDE